MSKAFHTLCQRAAAHAMSELHTDVQFSTSASDMSKIEHPCSKFPSASEVRARKCLNTILSPKIWASILGLTRQSINRFYNGGNILPEHQKLIFKVYVAVANGMLLEAHDIRKNSPNVNDWVAEELAALGLD